MKKKQLLSIIGVILVLALSFFGFGEDAPQPTEPFETNAGITQTTQASPLLDEDGHYNSKEDVALYIHLYGRLPENYITKSQCEDLGYANSDAEHAVEDGAIGGDRFQNKEKSLPTADGRLYYECDIDTWGKDERGPERIVWSNDGLIYYTPDHYESFELLYGEE